MRQDFINGDSLKVLNNMRDNSIDMVLTSPPYDDLRTYNSNIDIKEYIKTLYEKMVGGGVIVWVVQDSWKNCNQSLTSFKTAIAFQEAGFNVVDTMIWLKYGFSFPKKYSYPNCFEYMFVFSKGKPKTFNPIKDRENKWKGTKLHGTIISKDGSKRKITKDYTYNEYGVRFNYWLMKTSSQNQEQKFHTASFPLELATNHIKSWTNEGDLVVDIFGGSGTTAIACDRLNRDFISIELDKDFHDKSIERFNKEKK